jgi:hypothetical protein
MKWTQERDLLIAQTMAFVQSVTGKTPEPEPEARIVSNRTGEIEAVERSAEAVKMPQVPPVRQSDVREEIQDRVAAFRAHQQRFHRERDAYFNSVLTRVRAATENEPKAPLS